jgi:hypothetical protein
MWDPTGLILECGECDDETEREFRAAYGHQATHPDSTWEESYDVTVPPPVPPEPEPWQTDKFRWNMEAPCLDHRCEGTLGQELRALAALEEDEDPGCGFLGWRCYDDAVRAVGNAVWESRYAILTVAAIGFCAGLERLPPASQP